MAVVAGALLFVGSRIFFPPSWIIQRLDSPDGKRAAELFRTQYLQQNFAVHVRAGMLWHTAYCSPPLTNDDRVDLGERLLWSKDSNRLYFRMQGRTVWGHDFTESRDLSRAELMSSTGTDGGAR